MWGSFFTDMDLASIRNYQAAPFETDFYKYLVGKVNSRSGQRTMDETVLRERIKNAMRLVLFDDDPKHRNNGTYFKMFRELYPGVDKLIYNLLKEVGKTNFSYLLQRAESYIVLDMISRDFHENYPEAPVFTIHDAICTYPDYIQPLVDIANKHFLNIIGAPVELKVKPWQPEPMPKAKDINEEWAEIRPVVSLQDYQKKAHSVFQLNITRGRNFLQ